MNQQAVASAQTSGPDLCKSCIGVADQDQSRRAVVPRSVQNAQTATRRPHSALMQAQAILPLEGYR
jgi:hypothetical protein